MELKVDRRLSMVYPLDKNGARITSPDFESITMCDGEMIRVTGRGALVERWKADFITEALGNRYELDEEDLAERGLVPDTKTWNNTIGGQTDRPKYGKDDVEQEDLLQTFQPIDEVAIKELIEEDDTGIYTKVYEEFRLPIEMTLRADPEMNLTELFDGFAEVIEARK